MWKYAVNIGIRQHSWKLWFSIENCIRNDRENPCEEDWLPMKLYFEFLMLLTQIYCPLASASKLELLCVNDRIPARMEMTAYYVIRSNIPVDWIGHMIPWMCMYFVIFPSNYANRGDRLRLKLCVFHLTYVKIWLNCFK